MLSKEQALAVLEAGMVPLRERQKQWVQRRTRWWTLLYPALRKVALEHRESVMQEATRRALRGWPAYAMGLLLLAPFIAIVVVPNRMISSGEVVDLAVVTVPALLSALAFYLRMRHHVSLAVESRSLQ